MAGNGHGHPGYSLRLANLLAFDIKRIYLILKHFPHKKSISSNAQASFNINPNESHAIPSNVKGNQEKVVKPFLSEDFLLQSPTARTLYHEFAESMPIFDYHCHLPVAEIAGNKRFANLTDIWLRGDHYKWRAMRANGIAERLITGDASDLEKFQAWAATVPRTLRNPLYHWTHLELKRCFGVSGKLLCPETAEEIYGACSEMLRTDDFSTRRILQRMNVRVVCTTDDPVDTLEHHLILKGEKSFPVKVLPTFRPDKALAVDSPVLFNRWVEQLEAATDMDIADYTSFLAAIRKRHDFLP